MTNGPESSANSEDDADDNNPDNPGGGVAGDSTGIGDIKDSNTAPRELLSARPFPRAAKLWRDKGWIGTIPLPAKQKNPPPVGWTGRQAPFASNEQVSEWCRMAQYRRGNIAIHLGFPVEVGETEYQIVGIDVDNYYDNGKEKLGGSQLAALEDRLGKLPPTWVSTARASHGDYISGIRFFLVPAGLAFRGQADKDIEVIQKTHRFAVVWPSYNPKSGSQYQLYSPEAWEANRSTIGKDGASVETIAPPSREIPWVHELPILPDKWVDHLTNGKMVDDGTDIDMDSTVDEIEAWAIAQFNDPDKMCSWMKKKTADWKQQIDDEATSHDKLVRAHWELMNLAAEGHIGWSTALNEVSRHWVDDVMARSKRGQREMRMEMFRSRINALRKIKAKIDDAALKGASYTPKECVCVGHDKITQAPELPGTGGGLFTGDGYDDDVDDDGMFVGGDDGLEFISWGRLRDVGDYEMSDDGNAEFLCDLLRYKSGRVKWVEGYGWILWTDATPDRPARWVHDQDGMIHRAFWRVKRHQHKHAEVLYAEAEQFWKDQGSPIPMTAQMKAKFTEAKKYHEWAIRSGMLRPAEAAVRIAQRFPGVCMDINELNRNPYLLGVTNGVVELAENGAHLRDAEASDYITYNTGVDWTTYKGVPSFDIGKKLWEEYLDNFIPDMERRVAYQTILGHCLIGGNPERVLLVLAGGTSTGKSTMLRALGAALGDYGGPVTRTLFENHKLNPALASAIPMRMVFMSELDFGDKMSAATIKRMTGDDAVVAELKGVNVQVKGVPQFVTVIATNTPPEIDGADEALRRRLMVLPFDVRIDDRKDKKGASHQLEEVSKEAILGWLIEGYDLYRRNGLPYNQEIVKSTDAFAAELDPVSEFVAARIRRGGPDSKVTTAEVYSAYKMWCADQGIIQNNVLSQNSLTRRVKGLGYEKKVVWGNGASHNAFIGMKLTRRERFGNLNSVPELKLHSEKASGDSTGVRGNSRDSGAETVPPPKRPRGRPRKQERE